MTEPKRAVKDDEFELLGRTDCELLYWAIVDFLHSKKFIESTRRRNLTELAERLSRRVRGASKRESRTKSGVVPTARTTYIEVVRQRLRSIRRDTEVGVWAIYGEGVGDDPQSILLAIVRGTFLEAVEQALQEPGFITEGMGGQIDPLIVKNPV